MAGGMIPGRGMTLAERSRLSGIGTGGSEPDAPSSHTPRRHCWVNGPDADPGSWPGLVLQWRQTSPEGGWSAWVVYLVGDGEDALVVQRWVPREQLTPAD